MPLSCDSTSRAKASSTASIGALIAIISRICAWPSRSAPASRRSVMSRETPATPKMSPCALRTGTFVVRSQFLPPATS